MRARQLGSRNVAKHPPYVLERRSNDRGAVYVLNLREQTNYPSTRISIVKGGSNRFWIPLHITPEELRHQLRTDATLLGADKTGQEKFDDHAPTGVSDKLCLVRHDQP